MAFAIDIAAVSHAFNADNAHFQVKFNADVDIAREKESFTELLRRADKCLYLAKEQGRDRVVGESEMNDWPAGLIVT